VNMIKVRKYSQLQHLIVFWVILFVGFLTAPAWANKKQDQAVLAPPKNGLRIWLDAADKKSMDFGVDLAITRWKNKASKKWNAMRQGKQGPWCIKNVRNGYNSVRFTGAGHFEILDAFKSDRDAYAIFIVSQRVKELASDRSWQRLLSSDDPRILFIAGEKGKARGIQIDYGLFNDIRKGNLILGSDPSNEKQSFIGDVLEVLVYNRRFLVDEQVSEIKDYLQKKWAFKEDTKNDWTRAGPLPKKPKHKFKNLPLSDQSNQGKWAKYEPLWDEFDGSSLDLSKWWDHDPNWYGRAPSRYLAENVSVSDGNLKLVMKYEPDLPEENFYGRSYHTYSTAAVTSKDHVLYGYFEIKAKAMKSAGSSAWWFSGGAKDLKTGYYHSKEIDVFEIGGAVKGKEYDYNMNLHVFREGQDKRHWNRGGKWLSPKRFADEYHIFGLEWTKDYIRYYVDGGLVRSVKNTVWHTPLKMHFDSETMGDWLGLPKPENLPSTFDVKYVKAWKNSLTKGDYSKTHKVFTYSGKKKLSSISRYVRSVSKSRGTLKSEQ